MERKRLIFYAALLYASFSLFVLSDWFESLYQNYNSAKIHRWRRALRSDPRTVVVKKKNGKKNTDIIVLVMGEASAFQHWYQLIKDIDANLSLVFASYDEEVPNDLIESEEGFDCQAIFIPSKTWTQGRNALAEKALRKEEMREKEYSYWLFLDDDVEPACHEEADAVLGKGSCWQKIFNFLSSDAVPEKATSIIMAMEFNFGFTSASNADAFFAAFKREYVPYIMPYATLPYAASEWISQGAIYCLMATCMPLSAVYVPFVRAHNAKHRGTYIAAGFSVENVNKTIEANYYDESSDFYPCKDWNVIEHYRQGELGGLLVGPFITGKELNNHISKPATSYCAPMKNRFAKWEEDTLSVPTEKTTLPTSETGHSKIKISRDPDIDTIVLVMGEVNKFNQWYLLLKDIDANLSFVFASYDREVPSDWIEHVKGFDCQSIFIASKTWTEGRNLLAEEALRKEKLRGKEYSYWLFLDDDAEPVCEPEADEVLGVGSCWQKVFNFISSDAVPEKVSTIALPSKSKAGFASTSNADAFFAAFKREYVPYLLPYATLQTGASEWIGQAANFCLITTCAPYSAIFVPYVSSLNTISWKLIGGGYDVEHIQATITTNYDDESTSFHPCHEWGNIAHYALGELATFVAGPYSTPGELNQNIPDPRFSVCVSLRDRFAEWEKKTLSAPTESKSLPNPEIRRRENSTVSNIDILVMVMGEASTFQHWHQLLKDIDANLSFVYASFDVEVSTTGLIEDEKDFDYSSLFIVSKTWTEGRNLLAEEALRKEKLRGKEYSYWLFLDDDIQPICEPEADEVLGVGSCWQKVFNFISSDAVPEKASTIALPWKPKAGFSSTSSSDAMFAAFKREYVPYLLPYATLRKGISEWISQAANFCLMATCMVYSSVFVPYVKADNSKSRNYIREGFNITNIHAIVTENYHDASTGFFPCHEWVVIEHYTQGEAVGFVNGPYSTTEELNDHIPDAKFSHCVSLKNRFVEWREKVITAMR